MRNKNQAVAELLEQTLQGRGKAAWQDCGYAAVDADFQGFGDSVEKGLQLPVAERQGVAAAQDDFLYAFVFFQDFTQFFRQIGDAFFLQVSSEAESAIRGASVACQNEQTPLVFFKDSAFYFHCLVANGVFFKAANLSVFLFAEFKLLF